MRFYRYICLIVLLLSIFSYAEAMRYVITINGILTTRDEAETNRQMLLETMQQNIKIDTDDVVFAMIYNPTRGWMQDLKDVSWQKGNEVIDGYLRTEYAVAGVGTSTTLDYYNNEVINIAGGSSGDLGSILDDFTRLVPAPRSVFDAITSNTLPVDYSGTKDYILLVPHSEGSLYANKLYAYLTKNNGLNPKQIAIFAVASVAAHNLGAWPFPTIADSYVTSSNDWIVNLVRNSSGPIGVLPANIEIAFSWWLNGHDFVNVYLSDKTSATKITAGIDTVLKTFSKMANDTNTTELDKPTTRSNELGQSAL